MNTSEVQIINVGLVMIGSSQIGNLSDRGDLADKCRLLWPSIRGAVFRSHPWKCITKAAVLTQTTTTPVHTYDYAYVLPADFVRMVGMSEPDADYRVYGQNLHCDDSPAYIDYVYLCTDCTKYSDDLCLALSMNFAYWAGFGIAQSVEIANAIKADLEKFYLPIVRFADATGRGRRNVASTVLRGTFNE